MSIPVQQFNPPSAPPLPDDLQDMVDEWNNHLGVAADLCCEAGAPIPEAFVRAAMFRPIAFSRPWPRNNMGYDGNVVAVIAMPFGSALFPGDTMPRDLDYLCLCGKEVFEELGWVHSQGPDSGGPYPQGPFESFRYRGRREDWHQLNINAICSLDRTFIEDCVEAMAYCLHNPPATKTDRVYVFERFRRWGRENKNGDS